MYAPGMGFGARPSERNVRRRRVTTSTIRQERNVVPAIIEPQEELPIYHDPGPGVIGIDL